MVIPRQWVLDVERLIAEASPGPWTLQPSAHGKTMIATGRPDGKRLYISHDAEQAPEADIVFITKARNVLPRLLVAVTTKDTSLVNSEELCEIEELLNHVTAAPWISYIESKQPIGGCSMIGISHEDFGPDMYVWLEGQIAPDADIEFIAAARDAIPMLMSEIRYLRSTAGKPGR